MRESPRRMRDSVFKGQNVVTYHVEQEGRWGEVAGERREGKGKFLRLFLSFWNLYNMHLFTLLQVCRWGRESSVKKIHHPGEVTDLSDHPCPFHTCCPACPVRGITLLRNIPPEATFQNFPPLLLSLKSALLTLAEMTTRKVFFPLRQE